MKLRLRVTSKNVASTETTLQPPGGLLGRDPSCNFIIEHDSVSRAHAEVQWKEGSWLLYQRSGRGPTVADGQAVSVAPVVLKERGAIHLGGVSIEYWQEQSLPAVANQEAKQTVIEHVSTTQPIAVRSLLSEPTQAALSQLAPLPCLSDGPTLILPRNQLAGQGSPLLNLSSSETQPHGKQPRPSGPAPASAQALPAQALPDQALPAQAPVTVANPLRARPGLPSPRPGEPPSEPPVTVANPFRSRPNPPPLPPNDPPVTQVNPLRSAGRANLPLPAAPLAPSPQDSANVTMVNPLGRGAARPLDPRQSQGSGLGSASAGKAPSVGADGAGAAQPQRALDPSGALVAECRRLAGEVARLGAELAQLKKEREALKDAKAALESQLRLLPPPETQEQSLKGGNKLPSEQQLREQVLRLLEPFANSLEQATEKLMSGRADQVRELLRDASYGLGELRDLLRHRS